MSKRKNIVPLGRSVLPGYILQALILNKSNSDIIKVLKKILRSIEWSVKFFHAFQKYRLNGISFKIPAVIKRQNTIPFIFHIYEVQFYYCALREFDTLT